MSDLGRYLAGILSGPGENVSVAAPGPKRSVILDRQPNVIPHSHIDPVGVRCDAGWDQQVLRASRRSVAQFGAAAPNPKTAIGLDACRADQGRLNLHPVRRRAHLHRLGTVSPRTDSQLAEVVKSPGPQRTVPL